MVSSLNNLRYYKSNNGFVPTDNYFKDSFIKRVNNETQWIFPTAAIINSNANWTREIKSNGGDKSVVEFVEEEQNLHDNLPNTIAKFKSLIQQYLLDNNKHLNDLEIARRKADDANLAAATGVGILGGLGGVVAGFVVGFVIGLISEIASCINNPHGQSNKYDGIIMVSAITIGGLIGFIMSFNSKRNN